MGAQVSPGFRGFSIGDFDVQRVVEVLGDVVDFVGGGGFELVAFFGGRGLVEVVQGFGPHGS